MFIIFFLFYIYFTRMNINNILTYIVDLVSTRKHLWESERKKHSWSAALQLKFGRKWVTQQDNDLNHTSKRASEWQKKMKRMEVLQCNPLVKVPRNNK